MFVAFPTLTCIDTLTFFRKQSPQSAIMRSSRIGGTQRGMFEEDVESRKEREELALHADPNKFYFPLVITQIQF